jgi:hypothetical protein
VADRNAIVQLFSQYAVAIDTQAWALSDEIFTDDAVWEMEHSGREPVDKRGLAAIKQFLPGSRAAGQPRHIFTNLRVLDENEESACVTMYMLFAVTDEGTVNVVMTFVYTPVQYAPPSAGGSGTWHISPTATVGDSSLPMSQRSVMAAQKRRGPATMTGG